MNEFTQALGITRPVYWSLIENPVNTGGPPTETTGTISIQNLKMMGRGVFITPNELGDERNERGNLRYEGNVTRITSVFVDMDKGTPEEQRARLDRFTIPPSIIVKTGRGHHAYWILDRFEDVDTELWKRVQRTMAAVLYGDPACVDPARLMRLPGSWHVKGEARMVELIHCNPMWLYLLNEFPVQPLRTFILPDRGKDGSRKTVPLRPRPRMIGEGDRHSALVKEVARFFNTVAPSEVEERRAIIKAWYAQSCRPLKDYWEREVDDMIEWVLKKELGNFNRV